MTNRTPSVWRMLFRKSRDLDCSDMDCGVVSLTLRALIFVSALVLFMGALHAQSSAPNPVSLTCSILKAPFSIPYNLISCTASVSGATRTISGSMVKQALELSGISVVDPSLYSSIVAGVNGHSIAAKLLAGSKYSGIIGALASGSVSIVKANDPSVANSKAWGEGAVGAVVLAGLSAILQTQLQPQVSSAATITTGVQAALIMDESELFSVTEFGTKPMMLLGGGNAGVTVRMVIP